MWTLNEMDRFEGSRRPLVIASSLHLMTLISSDSSPITQPERSEMCSRNCVVFFDRSPARLSSRCSFDRVEISSILPGDKFRPFIPGSTNFHTMDPITEIRFDDATYAAPAGAVTSNQVVQIVDRISHLGLPLYFHFSFPFNEQHTVLPTQVVRVMLGRHGRQERAVLHGFRVGWSHRCKDVACVAYDPHPLGATSVVLWSL